MEEARPTGKQPAPSPVVIEQVENGYLLTVGYAEEMRYPRRPGRETYEIARPHVFQTMAELLAYLPTYFTHRNAAVTQDSTAL